MCLLFSVMPLTLVTEKSWKIPQHTSAVTHYMMRTVQCSWCSWCHSPALLITSVTFPQPDGWRDRDIFCLSVSITWLWRWLWLSMNSISPLAGSQAMSNSPRLLSTSTIAVTIMPLGKSNDWSFSSCSNCTTWTLHKQVRLRGTWMWRL